MVIVAFLRFYDGIKMLVGYSLIMPRMDHLGLWRGSLYHIVAARGDGKNVMLVPLYADNKSKGYRWKRLRVKFFFTRKVIIIDEFTDVDLWRPDLDRYEEVKAVR